MVSRYRHKPFFMEIFIVSLCGEIHTFSKQFPWQLTFENIICEIFFSHRRNSPKPLQTLQMDFLEEPQLVCGNKTILKPGMVFAVDGSTSEKNFRSQVGDSFIVTDNGYEAITDFPKSLDQAIIRQ